jgi:hypothetical protein
MRPPGAEDRPGRDYHKTAVPSSRNRNYHFIRRNINTGKFQNTVERRGLEDNFYFLFFEYYIDFQIKV